MKKNLLIYSLIISLIAVTSCFNKKVAYRVIYDEKYHLRAIQEYEDATYLSVDEYEYPTDVYEGKIEMNITIPKEIHSLPIEKFGRTSFYAIEDQSINAQHNQASKFGNNELNSFAIMVKDNFKEGTIFDIYFNIEAKLSDFPTNYARSTIFIYNINAVVDSTNHDLIYPCQVYFNLSGENTKYYSKDGSIYQYNQESCFLNKDQITTVRVMPYLLK